MQHNGNGVSDDRTRADQAYLMATRNLGPDVIQAIERHPQPADDDDPLTAHAKACFIAAAAFQGVSYDSGGMHHRA